MKKVLLGLAVIFLARTGTLAADRWVHVKVEEGGTQGETVRINLPLSLAEKVLPAIHTEKLCAGKVKVSKDDIHDLDLRAVMEALRAAPDNEFITVESQHENVRVAKAGGNLLIKVQENKETAAGTKAKTETKTRAETVNVTIPIPVVEALLSGAQDELDILAAVRALGAVGNTVLVSVDDQHSKVRIWVDSRNTME
jgi:ribosomal protein S11